MALISHQYKFVLLHAPKTGGSSMRTVLRPYIDMEVTQHATPLEMCREFGAELLLIDYIWVLFVRNPWERFVSWYHYMKTDERDPNHKHCKDMDFREFMLWLLPEHAQVDYLKFPEGYQYKTKIGYFENLKEDFSRIFTEILGRGISLDVHENKTNYNHYSNFYEDHYIDVIEKDSLAFNYKFEDLK